MQQPSNGCLEQILSALAGILLVFFAGAGAAVQMSSSVPMPLAEPSIELVLQPVADVTEAQLNETLAVIQARLNALTAGSQVAAASAESGDASIVVRLAPGTMALENVQVVLTQRGLLEALDTGGAVTPAQAADLVGSVLPPDYVPVITNVDIAKAEAVEDQNMGGYVVVVNFTPEGAATLGAFTESHIGQVLPVTLDGVVLIAPLIQAQVADSAVISGAFTADEAAVLAAQISTAPLPVALVVASIDVIEQR